MRVAHNLIDLTGKQFGKLTVSHKSGSTWEGKAIWHCKCECGKTSDVVARSLRRGATTSCGCNRQRSHRKLPPFEAGINVARREYQRGALDRNLVWELSDARVKELFLGNCFYCGTPPSRIIELGKYNGDAKINGIDRIENTEGYTVNNTVSCCTQCNRAKSDLTQRAFQFWISKLVEYNSK